MKVYKFGGASVKNAAAVRNLGDIITRNIGFELVIVVSAMGKMTNHLEKVVEKFFFEKGDITNLLLPVEKFHLDICNELFHDVSHGVFREVQAVFDQIKNSALKYLRSGASFDFLYDQIVSQGEILSSIVVSNYLNQKGIYTLWLDARKLIITDDLYREAVVNWEETTTRLIEKITFEENNIYVTQGFIGSTPEGHSTTLGREGSDFTAAIIGNALSATEVVIWKDVPGLLNADPKFFSETKKLNNISYHEAIELAYYGATVIHPKTIKPLQNKGIPLFVKSFLDDSVLGSTINENTAADSLIPSYIFKTDQVLFSIFTRDYSFINEKVLSELFSLFALNRVKINLMENSAISFTACFDFDEKKLKAVTEALRDKYKVLYNKGLELMTVRHYDQETLNQLMQNKEVLVEQRSRHTARLVMKSKKS